MPAAGVAPTKKRYNTAITACGDGGQWPEAIRSSFEEDAWGMHHPFYDSLEELC